MATNTTTATLKERLVMTVIGQLIEISRKVDREEGEMRSYLQKAAGKLGVDALMEIVRVTVANSKLAMVDHDGGDPHALTSIYRTKYGGNLNWCAVLRKEFSELAPVLALMRDVLRMGLGSGVSVRDFQDLLGEVLRAIVAYNTYVLAVAVNGHGFLADGSVSENALGQGNADFAELWNLNTVAAHATEFSIANEYMILDMCPSSSNYDYDENGNVVGWTVRAISPVDILGYSRYHTTIIVESHACDLCIPWLSSAYADELVVEIHADIVDQSNWISRVCADAVTIIVRCHEARLPSFEMPTYRDTAMPMTDLLTIRCDVGDVNWLHSTLPFYLRRLHVQNCDVDAVALSHALHRHYNNGGDLDQLRVNGCNVDGQLDLGSLLRLTLLNLSDSDVRQKPIIPDSLVRIDFCSSVRHHDYSAMWSDSDVVTASASPLAIALLRELRETGRVVFPSDDGSAVAFPVRGLHLLVPIEMASTSDIDLIVPASESDGIGELFYGVGIVRPRGRYYLQATFSATAVQILLDEELDTELFVLDGYDEDDPIYGREIDRIVGWLDRNWTDVLARWQSAYANRPSLD